MAAKVKVEPGGSMIVPRASAIGAKQKPISKSAASGFAPFRTLGDPIRATSGRLETDVPARSQKSYLSDLGLAKRVCAKLLRLIQRNT
jgi:hypothetical protein